MASSSAAHDLSALDKDPRLFLYTSLTAGSSHIITATSRMETILKANRIPFLAIDTATDEKARRLWGRRAGKKKLPGLVKEGYVLGDLEQIEEWNEFGELKENIGPVPPTGVATNPAPPLPIKPTATAGTAKIAPPKPGVDESKMRPLPGAAEVAARNKPLPISSPEDAVKPESMGSAPADKEKSIAAAKAAAEKKGVEHLSAPPSAIPSGAATPKEGDAALPNDQAADAVASSGDGTVEARHRGSDVVAAPGEEIKKVESANAIAEDDGDEDESVAKGVEGMQVGEGKKVAEQSAKEPDDAGKSVED